MLPANDRDKKFSALCESPYVAIRDKDGYIVYHADNNQDFVLVTDVPSDPYCPCRDYVYRQDRENRCRHVQAVFRYLNYQQLVAKGRE